ncbi:GNAT family N-acetyltransferase [Rufibacter immobilis]|uniref:GNAT family N-acetyltransferase n=1 Tax=Rufibacter immobilis TaxID=1348778 RepID=A0A3M9MVM3_9BACT|nr:GNAT family N-acetyltransferase [Rufibacter immobilis]RNI29592.1 GNAT family N-acetyltransferase [Rufibacter immobilis]
MAGWETESGYELRCLTTPAERQALPPFSFDVFLFLQPAHVALQAGPDWQMFVLVNRRTGLVDGVAHFFQEERNVFSPWRAPFGGVQLNLTVPEEAVHHFLQNLHQQLRHKGLREVKWLQCPDAYAPQTNQLLRATLPAFGYTTRYDQRNHHVPVSAVPFAAQAHPSIKRRLMKCQQAGFTFQQETLAELPEAYAFLKQCREEKQKPLSLSLPQLTRYFELFPERYFLFTVRREGELAAVGVAVLVSNHILNHLYPASPRRFNAYSPSVLLNAGLYQFCQQRQIPMLDLGVSAPVQEDEAEYAGLFTFKERLGGVESLKPTFVRSAEEDAPPKTTSV